MNSKDPSAWPIQLIPLGAGMPPSLRQDGGKIDSLPQALILAAMPNTFPCINHQEGLKPMGLHLGATPTSFKGSSQLQLPGQLSL